MFASLKEWIAKHRSLLVPLMAVALLYGGFFAVGITCPIKYFTGISCAGCGMSRAWFHAITFRFSEAFGYNPVFWIVPFLIVFWAIKKRHPRIGRIGLGLCLAVMLIAYGIRMLDPNDTIVVFAPKDSSVYRISHAVIEKIKALLML